MNGKPPLGLPEGSIRAILALVIVASVMIPYMVSALLGDAEVPASELLALVVAAAGAYGIQRVVK